MVKELFKLNCSTLFLLSPLGLTRKNLEGTGFVNCYLRDENRPEYEGLYVVFLLFKPKSKFRYFVDGEKIRTPLLIDEYLLEDDYTALVYEFPEDLYNDFEVFKRGEYSNFSSRFKSLFPDKTSAEINKGIHVAPSLQWMIIHQVQEWKKILEEEWNITMEEGQQLWNIPNMQEETLTIPPKKIAPEK